MCTSKFDITVSWSTKYSWGLKSRSNSLEELIIYLSKFRGSSLYPRWFGFQPMENRHLRPAWPKTNSPPELEPPTWVSLRSLVGWLVGWLECHLVESKWLMLDVSGKPWDKMKTEHHKQQQQQQLLHLLVISLTLWHWTPEFEAQYFI